MAFVAELLLKHRQSGCQLLVHLCVHREGGIAIAFRVNAEILFEDFVLIWVRAFLGHRCDRRCIPHQSLLPEIVYVGVLDLLDFYLSPSCVQAGEPSERLVIVEPKIEPTLVFSKEQLDFSLIKHVEVQWTNLFYFHSLNVLVKNLRNSLTLRWFLLNLLLFLLRLLSLGLLLVVILDLAGLIGSEDLVVAADSGFTFNDLFLL